MSFASPWWLLGLLVLPMLVAGYVLDERRRVRAAAAFGRPALVPNVVERSPGARRHLPVVVLLLGLVALVVGVARPQATVHEPRQEATVVVAIDVSRSMAATDVAPSRLAAAIAAAKTFLAKVPRRYRVALVSFSSRAVLALPPTSDRSDLDEVFRSLTPGDGTALGDAVAVSAATALRQRAPDKTLLPAALLVLSDGAPDGGRTALAAAERAARQAHMPVYALPIGTPGGVVEEKLTGGYRATVQVPAQPQTLEQIAQQTGGEVFSGGNDPRLGDVYSRLGSRLGSVAKRRELADAAAALGAVLLVSGAALSALWFGRVL